MAFVKGQHVAVVGNGPAWFGYVDKVLEDGSYRVRVGGTADRFETLNEGSLQLADAYVRRGVLRNALQEALGARGPAIIPIMSLAEFPAMEDAFFERMPYCSCHATGEHLVRRLGTDDRETLGSRDVEDSAASYRAMMATVGNRLRNAASLVVWVKLGEHSITLVKTKHDELVEAFETMAGQESNAFDLHENLYCTFLLPRTADEWAADLVRVVDDSPATRQAAGARMTSVTCLGYKAFSKHEVALTKIEIQMAPMKPIATITRQVGLDAAIIAAAPAYQKMVTQQRQLYAYGFINARRGRLRVPPFTHDM